LDSSQLCSNSDASLGLPSDVKRFAKGLTVYHEGDSAEHWYEVVSGIVRTCRFLADGHRQLTGFFYVGDVFGVESSAYREAAEAVTNVELRRFPIATADARADGFGNRDKVLEKALESARQSIFLFGHRTAANRLAAFLISISERPGASPGLHLPMTRSDIADHLNLTLHTVSRTICDFARRGLIALDGPQKVRVLDLTGLRMAAGDAEEYGLGWKDEPLCKSA
jgi:CRP-like cAMP-binding protein